MPRGPEFQKRFGARCRELRRKAKLSQLDVIRRFEFSLSHYQKLERGDLDPRLSTLIKLCEVYGVSLAVLVRGLDAAK